NTMRMVQWRAHWQALSTSVFKFTPAHRHRLYLALRFTITERANSMAHALANQLTQSPAQTSPGVGKQAHSPASMQRWSGGKAL
ncbi:hypothetical protein CWC28_22210, partial [Pseudoalteromonas sp. S4492]